MSGMWPYRIRRLNRSTWEKYQEAKQALDMALYLWHHAGQPKGLRAEIHHLAMQYLDAKRALGIWASDF